jgi:hypothetical protein
VILKNGQSSCGLQLFIIESHQVRLSFFNFEIHLFIELSDSKFFGSFVVVYVLHALLVLELHLHFQNSNLLNQVPLICFIVLESLQTLFQIIHPAFFLLLSVVVVLEFFFDSSL